MPRPSPELLELLKGRARDKLQRFGVHNPYREGGCSACVWAVADLPYSTPEEREYSSLVGYTTRLEHHVQLGTSVEELAASLR